MEDLEPSDLTFSGFVLSLASTAAVHFGDLPDPATGRKGQAELDAAARIIEVLAMLQQKTKGNLIKEEERLVDDLLYELRLRYVQAQQDDKRIIEPLKITFLGTGTSSGVPMIGCECSTCRSTDPRDRRLRPSIFVEADDGTAVLVDAGPDLREQALTHRIRRVDAVLFTHGHADHILGMDDIRRFNVMQKRPMPCYGDVRTIADIRQTFSYAFDPVTQKGGGLPQIVTFTIHGEFCLGRQEVVPVPLYHGARPILGLRVGAFAYLTDCNRIPDSSWALLEGLEVLVLDALRERPHPTHFTLGEAIEVSRRIAARRTYFTHMCHDLPHAATSARLPGGMELSYDGLVVECP